MGDLERSRVAVWDQTATPRPSGGGSGAGAEGAGDVGGGEDAEDAAVDVEEEVLTCGAGTDGADQVLTADPGREAEAFLEGTGDRGGRDPGAAIDGHGEQGCLVHHPDRRPGRRHRHDAARL